MSGRNYIDFDITMQAVGARYEAQVASIAGSASSEFELPFSERELDDFFALFGGRRVRRMESPQLERARAFGGRLYRAVFDEAMDALLARSLTAAGEQGNGLRIRIRLDDAPDLVNIPWEYLYRPASDDFFALSNWTPIVRFLEVEARMPPAPIEPPLRILVMISDPIEYQGSLDVMREWDRLQESLADLIAGGHVQLHRLERATERDLLRELRRNDHHIFHFVGHGEFNEQENDGVLLLEDDHRRTKLVTGRALGTVLRDNRTLRLVVLNNCEGARSSDTDPFAGAAQSLIQKGLPAVAAMQFEVTDDAAISFAHEFYAGLSDGYPVDAALAEARKAIYQGATRYEFGSPVLYLAGDDGVIFDITAAADMPPALVTPPEETEPEAPSHAVATEPDVRIAGEGGEGPTKTEEVEALSEQPAVSVSDQEPVVARAPTREIETDPEPDTVPAEPVPARTVPDAPTREMTSVPGATGRRRTPLLWGLGAIVGLAAVVAAVIGLGGGDVTETTQAPLETTAGAGAPATTVANTTVAGVAGVVPEPAQPPSIADRVVAAPAIDGDDDEWTSRFVYTSVHRVFGAENVDGDADLSATWRLAWDGDFLYFFAEVRDDVIAQVNTGASLFRGDAVAFYFDGDLSDDSQDAQLSDDDLAFFFAPSSSENWVRLIPAADGTAFGGAGAITADPGVRAATAISQGGYAIEGRVPWSLLGVSVPQPGDEFRMTLDVSDNDTAGTSDQQAMISNSVGRTAAAQSFPAVWEKMSLAG